MERSADEASSGSLACHDMPLTPAHVALTGICVGRGERRREGEGEERGGGGRMCCDTIHMPHFTFW